MKTRQIFLLAGWMLTTGLSAAVSVTDGLIIHLDAGSLTSLSDGQAVGAWPDAAAGDSVDGTVTSQAGQGQPVYKANVRNGHPAVRFVRAESDVLVSQPWSLPTPSQGVTVFTVCTGGTSGNVERVLQVGAAAGTASRLIAADAASTQSGCRYNNGYALTPTGANPVSAGVFHVSVRQMAQGGRHDSLYYAVNGSVPQAVQANSGATTIVFDADNNSLSVGNGKDPAGAWYPDYFNGDVSEILVYNRQLSAAEITDVLLELGQKYAIAVEKDSILVETADGLRVQEGGVSDAFTVRLLSNPGSSPVTVSAADSLDPAQVTIQPPQAVFTSQNWQSAQTFTVTAVDDGAMERPVHDTTLLLNVSTSPASPYYGQTIGDMWVDVEDNDCGSRGFSPADYNLDCRVDLQDFLYYAEQWVECGTPDPECL